MSQDHFLNLQPGTVINGRYEIVKCLGTGSMGMVYACRHRELAGHMVAMKVLFAEVARDSVAAARFRNEIVASYGVSHPNVVRAYEYFRDGDLIAFTMEYIGGGDLADRINSDQPLGIDEIVRMLHQMCQGVQAIHEAGIIHRDLKPENILITGQGDIKITDFGIARTGSGPKLTDHGGVVGTIDYVSPEYLERGQVDARSDIYALGVLAYEMITGESPFRGQSVIETMTMRLRSDPEPPHNNRPDCPIELSNIVLKALVRDPDKRYQTSAEMASDLGALRDKLPQRSTRSGVRPTRERRHSSRNASEARNKSEGDATRRAEESTRSATATDTQKSGVREARGSSGSGARGGRSGTEPQSQGTVLIDPTTVKNAAREQLKNVLGSQTHKVPGADRLDSVLPQRGRVDDDLFSSQGENGSANTPSISMSVGKLSQERIRELYSDIQTPDDEGYFKNFVGVLFVIAIGFGFGFFLMQVVKPELFSDTKDAEPKTYFDDGGSSP